MSRSSPVPEWIPADLPAAPGVYRFLDGRGAALYIGKSVNLRRRVRGHFYGAGPDGRLADLFRLARGLLYSRTGSDLEARLREARAILEHRPRFNRAIKNRTRGWYLELDEGTPFPRPRVVRSLRRPSANYFGPYTNRYVPREIARLTENLFGLRDCPGGVRPDPAGAACLRHEIGSCSAPCVGVTGLNEYRRRVREAIRTLSDRAAAVSLRSSTLARRHRAVRDLSFEEAASLERQLRWLDELEGYRGVLERPSPPASFLVILPHHVPSRRVLLPVAAGRVLPLREADQHADRLGAAVFDACYAVRVRELRLDRVLEPGEMALSMIFRRWLDQGAADGVAFDLARLDAAQIVTAITPGAAWGDQNPSYRRPGGGTGPAGAAGRIDETMPGWVSQASNASA